MVGNVCVVKTCINWDTRTHTFPNPDKNRALFDKWLELCCSRELYSLPPMIVYKNRRVCRKHFADNQFGTNNRLLRTAYPTLNLPTRANDTLSRENAANATLNVPILPEDLLLSTDYKLNIKRNYYSNYILSVVAILLCVHTPLSNFQVSINKKARTCTEFLAKANDTHIDIFKNTFVGTIGESEENAISDPPNKH